MKAMDHSKVVMELLELIASYHATEKKPIEAKRLAFLFGTKLNNLGGYVETVAILEALGSILPVIQEIRPGRVKKFYYPSEIDLETVEGKWIRQIA